MKNKYLTLLTLISIPLFGQTYSAEEFISSGIEQHNNKAYDKAIADFIKVNISDPKYISAQYEIINSLLADRKLDEALKLSTQLFEEKKHLEAPYLLALHGIVLSENNKLDEAIQMFDLGLKNNPESTHLLLNKAVVLYKQKKNQEVLDLYKKIISIDPSHTSVLFHLGNLALEDGKIVEGSLSLMTFLMLDPLSSNAISSLSTLNKKYHQNYNNKPTLKYSETGDQFKELEELLNAQVQYHTNYQLKIGIDDIVVRNMQAIIDYFETHDIKNGYFENQFGKHFKEIALAKHTKNYLYLSLGSISSNFEKEYSKNDKEIKNYVDNFLIPKITENYFIGYRGNQKYKVFRENNEKVFLPLNKENELEGTGIVEDFLGTKKADITYKNNNLNGVKNYYQTNGNLNYSENYVNGEITGAIKNYDVNKQLILDLNSKNGKADGKYTTYYPTSGKNCEGTYVDDSYNGLSECFYADGTKKIIANYKNGLFNGEYKRYNETGTLVLDTNYTDNEIDGNFLEYYDNGTLKLESKYIKGKPVTYTSYHSNKKIENQITYKDHKIVSSELFSVDGKLLEKENYDAKENLISEESFDENGHKYQTHFFKNGKYSHSEFQFANAPALKNKDKTQYQNYNALGNLIAEGSFEKSKPVGEWSYYNELGYLKSKTTFDNNGDYLKIETFLNNGQRDYKVSYKENLYNGLFEDFWNNKIKYTQYYDENGLNGPEILYYDNGKISTNSFYTNNNLENEKFSYTQNQTLYRKDILSSNLTLASTFYLLDTPFTFDFAEKNGKFTIKETTAITKTVELKNGQLHGTSVKQAGSLVLNKENYVNNVLHGKQIYNAPTGKLTYEADYFAGKRHGFSKKYDHLGNLTNSLQFEWGKENFVRTIFIPGINKKSTEVNYINDQRHGTNTIFGTNGETLAIIHYYYDTPTSYQTVDKNGELSSKTPYTKETNKIESYYKNGKKALEINFKNFLYNGDYKLNFEDGSLAYHVQYNSGWLNGSQHINYENGQRYMQTSFINGKQEGNTIYFDKNGDKLIETEYSEDEIHGNYKIYENNKIKHNYTYDSDILVAI